ncbi:unnamed protein product [Caenorhabditis sp. 36 PRJEB53466]|nr:unnamed protein product [Caenorhabditis sp. 36 PRJEB53466]
MGVETTPVYPVSTVSMSSAPPPYTVGQGAAPIAVEMQPVYISPAYGGPIRPTATFVQAQVVQPTAVIVTCDVKHVEYDVPYLEYCPRCQTTVTTRTVHTTGGCWWAIFIIGCFVCWPIWFWLCCASSKDVKHFCPNCASYLAVKKRGC